jgi:hypothetical protein
MGPPVCHAIDDSALEAQYNQAKAEMGRGGISYLKIMGPQGQTKWDSGVPIGYEGYANVHICGPWAAGKPIFVRKKKYFWRSHSKPKGTSIIVPEGDDPIAKAMELASSSSDPAIQTFIKNYGKPRTNYVYNVLNLDNLQLHIGQDGVMRPLILDEGKQLHTAIGGVFKNAAGASNIVDYQHGRPVRLVRKKTGPNNMDIEWDAFHSMNPAPVPQEFWPALQNLWDLEKFVKVPTLDEIQQAILDMGLPVPTTTQMQVPQGYNPSAAPPHGNPYDASRQTQMPTPNMAPQPPVFGPPPTMAPPPVYSQGQAPMPAPVAQVSGNPPAPPPGLNPPPVTSGALPLGPTASMAPPPPLPQATGQFPTLTLPLAPGTILPEERQRCFGKFNQTDNFCIQCPDWVKNQCMPQSSQQQAPPPVDGGLAALQAQMQGQ